MQIICSNCYTLIQILRSSITEENRDLECPVCQAQLPEKGKAALLTIYGPTPPRIGAMLNYLELKQPGAGRALVAYAYAMSNQIRKDNEN